MRRLVPCVFALALACSANSNLSTRFTDDADDPADAAPLTDTPPIDALASDTLDAPPDLDRTIAPLDVPRPDLGNAEVMNRYDVTPSDGCDVVEETACSPRAPGCEAVERCNNGLDDDCNGMADERCPCVPGTIQVCSLGPPGTHNVGVCREGTQRCVGVGEFGDWQPCINGITPSAETCDHLDNDCDGCADDGLCCDGPADGMCHATLLAGTVTPSGLACFVDEVVSRNNPGALVYQCRGGAATATFGANRFEGSYMAGRLDVRLTTMFRFSDGCDWVSTQRIFGDPHAPTLQYDYQEAIAPGQRGCASACAATATVTVRP